MDNVEINSEFQRLDFENIIWVIFVFLSILNLFGDSLEKEYLESNNNSIKTKTNQLFIISILATLLIYIYFFLRNYYALYNISDDKKELYTIKILASIFFVLGTMCLLYFQINQSSFIGTPAI